ncbi:MAG: Crp/Fnr family transcriptional regulator [Burkholderiaceae bacterium]
MKVTQIHPGTRDISDCGKCAVRENSLFSDFTEEDFRLIHAPIEDFRFAPGSVIFKQGDKVTGLYTIRSGMVKLNRLNADGTQRILRILRIGDIIGLEASLSQHYENDAIAINTVTACRVPSDVIKRLDRESPRLHRNLMQKWHETVIEADQWFGELTNGLARVRMARLLLKMRDSDDSDVSSLFSLEDIGSVLGMTIETASRIINTLLREGKIRRINGGDRHYQIDIAALEKESQSNAF